MTAAEKWAAIDGDRDDPPGVPSNYRWHEAGENVPNLCLALQLYWPRVPWDDPHGTV